MPQQAAPLPRDKPRPPAPAPKLPFASRLFGFDVFISFALGAPPRGSQSYASDLARRLRERDQSVFFSEDEAPPGSPLSATLAQALRRSALLVVLVNRGTLQQPNWVRKEVEAFRAQGAGRPVIPIDLDDCLADAALSAQAQGWLKHTEHIWLPEAPEAARRGLASDALVERLLTAPQRLRANTKWRVLQASVAAGLLSLAALAAWQAVVATRERDHASALGRQALSRQLAAQSAGALVQDPVRALLLAAQAHRTEPTPAADSALLGALAAWPVRRMAQHGAALQTLAVHPDGQRLVVADVRGAIVQDGLHQPAPHTVLAAQPGLALYRSVHALAWSPDGSRWAHAGSSREIVLHTGITTQAWPDGDKIGETTVKYVFGLAFSPDGQALVTASSSGALRWRDLRTGETRLLLGAATDLTAVAYSPDGRWVAAGGDGGLLTAVPVVPGFSPPRLSTSARDTVQALAFTADGRRLLAAARDNRLELFDTRDGRRLAQQETRELGALTQMALSADGRFVATGHSSGEVMLWQPDETSNGPWARQLLLRHAGAVNGLAFAPDGRTLVTAGADGRLWVSLPVDRGRWQVVPAETATAPASAVTSTSASGSSPASIPASASASTSASMPAPDALPTWTFPGENAGKARSPDGRWQAWPGTVKAPDSPFQIDLGRLSDAQVPRLSIVRASDQQVVVDGAELPARPGERVQAGPVFTADSQRLAVQVDGRLMLWDLPHRQAVDAALNLPLGTGLSRTVARDNGWLAQGNDRADRRYFFSANPQDWLKEVCALAGRPLTAEEWQRYVGQGPLDARACMAGAQR